MIPLVIVAGGVLAGAALLCSAGSLLGVYLKRNPPQPRDQRHVVAGEGSVLGGHARHVRCTCGWHVTVYWDEVAEAALDHLLAVHPGT